MAKVTLSASTQYELMRLFRAATKDLPQRAEMIPSLRWTIETRVWANGSHSDGPFKPELLGPPTQVLGPSFETGAIERSRVSPGHLVVADGREYEVVLSPRDQARDEVRVGFGFFVADDSPA